MARLRLLLAASSPRASSAAVSQINHRMTLSKVSLISVVVASISPWIVELLEAIAVLLLSQVEFIPVAFSVL